MDESDRSTPPPTTEKPPDAFTGLHDDTDDYEQLDNNILNNLDTSDTTEMIQTNEINEQSTVDHKPTSPIVTSRKNSRDDSCPIEETISNQQNTTIENNMDLMFSNSDIDQPPSTLLAGTNEEEMDPMDVDETSTHSNIENNQFVTNEIEDNNPVVIPNTEETVIDETETSTFPQNDNEYNKKTDDEIIDNADINDVNKNFDGNDNDDLAKLLSTTTNDEPMDEDNNDTVNDDNNRPEEVDMDNLDEIEKDKSVQEDPFESLKNSHTIDLEKTVDNSKITPNTIENNESTMQLDILQDEFDVVATTNIPAEPEKSLNDTEIDEISKDNENIDKDNIDHTDPPDASKSVDVEDVDIQGVDEELSLLPDAEREITDADKEKAIVAEDTNINDVIDFSGPDEVDLTELDDDNDAEDDATKENDTDENTDKTQTGEEDSANGTTNSSTTSGTATGKSVIIAPAENEIREMSREVEKDCYECKNNLKCMFAFTFNGQVHHLCQLSCVTALRRKSATKFSLICKKISITQICDVTQTCIQCKQSKTCKFRMRKVDKTYDYLCDEKCANEIISKNTDKYVLKKKRYTIEEIPIVEDVEACHPCIQCSETKKVNFNFKQDDEELFICNHTCMNLLLKEQPDRFRMKKRTGDTLGNTTTTTTTATTTTTTDTSTTSSNSSDISTTTTTTTAAAPATATAKVKQKTSTTSTSAKKSANKTDNGKAKILVGYSEQTKIVHRTAQAAELARLDRETSFNRNCQQCFKIVQPNDRSLYWETLDFCNETCLGQYQNFIGSSCTTCRTTVTLTSLGKYCVRFGYDIRQFCKASCLDEFKKGLKVCSYCHVDITKNPNGFLASINEQFKDFCSQICMKKYEDIFCKKKTTVGLCGVCNTEKLVRVRVNIDDREHYCCSNPCFTAFTFVNNISPDQCSMCSKYFERKSTESFTIYQDSTSKVFCSKYCMNIFIIVNRKIVPCQWCKVKKYSFDMIQKYTGANAIMLCSLNCLTLCEVSMNAISMKRLPCDHCSTMTTPQYHLTMSDASIRNFCTYQCVMNFQAQFSRAPLTLDGEIATNNTTNTNNNTNANTNNQVVPTGLPKRVKSGATVGATSGNNGTTAINSNSTSSTPNNTNNKSSTLPKVNSKYRPVKPQQSSTVSNLKSSTSKVPIISNVTSLASGILTRRGGKINSKELMDQISLSLQPVVELEPLPPMLLKKTTTGSYTIPPQLTTRTRGIRHLDSNTYDYSPSISPPTTPASSRRVPTGKVEYKTQIVTVPPLPKSVSNISTMCKPISESKSTMCKPLTNSVECQTDGYLEKKVIIPVPVPIYIPIPMHMYSLPTPIPVPIPLPIPVPIFIPTTRNSAQGIMKEIKKIQDKMPTDPFEAELLMMAEMVAGDKKKDDSDSDSDDVADDDFTTETITENNTFGEDMLQMALKMATEYEEPAVDLESAMTANTITPNSHPHLGEDGVVDEHNQLTQLTHQHPHHLLLLEQQHHQQQQQQQQRQGLHPTGSLRGRKRGIPNQRNRMQQVGGMLGSIGGMPVNMNNDGSPIMSPSPNKRSRRQEVAIVSPQPEQIRETVEKADANMCLKFTFGVNAWKQWVMTKNADLEKTTIRRKPFKSELLQLTADELNYSLCLFVKEVRKPNGSEYAPDTIYYLVLGIQQYLYENGRIDNIFTDPYYEKFTDCLDDVAKKFSVLYNDSQYIVTRVEEEHLWECKQLGAHSPHVLLSTLMFFNTKHFNLTTVEEHMQLSFSHIMKHWKRNPNQVGQSKLPGSRNVLLRFYPPQSALDNNSRKKKVYEQQENEENPLRCPVKLYEFYLSKCPESVKTRNDVFYLQPERSCVPDSPVWYSTQALGQESLAKMLHRVKMVKEINIALLTS